MNRQRSIEIASSLQNTHRNTAAQRNESNVFNEFSIEEAQNRRKNFEFITSFRTRDTMGLNNSHNLDQQPEYWRIDKTLLHIPGDRTSQTSLSVDNLPSRKRQDARNVGFLKVQVSDIGSGIAEKDLNALFELGGTEPSKYRGKVKGLWICKQLCQKLGGDLKVFSQVNKGTTFVFYLPITSNPRINSLPNPQRPMRNKLSALVVDDYAFNRDLHKLFLEKEGVEVTIACDGKEAWEKYCERGEDGFDFVMMDIQMPVMDGFTAAEKIREYEAEEHQKRVDIYFVSGEYYHQEDVIARFQAKSSDGKSARIMCLKKPVNAEMIRSIVNRYRSRIQRIQTSQNI